MRFLIDTNVFISSEPGRQDQVDDVTRQSLELAQAVAGEHTLMVHPTVSDEIGNDRDEGRRMLRDLVRSRYPTLEAPPAVPQWMETELGAPNRGSHDWYDHQLLACVACDAVHGLITQDDRIHRKARRLHVEHRVHTVADALSMLGQLADRPPAFIPSVELRPMHSVDLTSSFFDSLRDDYGGEAFDQWFQDKARSGRKAYVIDGPSGLIAGICIVKAGDDEIGVGGRVAKVCTLKVSEADKGNRYGELLLKALFRDVAGVHDALWVTVYPKQEALIALIESFGFFHHDDHAGERRYAKRLTPLDGDRERLSPLEFHTTFGPPALAMTPDQTFIIPIEPTFHNSLFPDAPLQQLSLMSPRPHGNALRKAYLCHANIRTAEPGATLLFYRSHDQHAVTTVGVLEQSLVSNDAAEILGFVGSRTVYSSEEVGKMAARGSVLAFLFRQDRFLEPPITVQELMGAHAVARAPQTTISIRPEGIPWLTNRLDA